LEGLGIENVVTFYGHLEYFTAIWYNLQPFGIVCGHFGIFLPFWHVWTKKYLATLEESGADSYLLFIKFFDSFLHFMSRWGEIHSGKLQI
jgi:hypothetical protein